MNAHSELTIPSIPTNYTRVVARELGLQERGLPELLWKTGLSPQDITQDDLLIAPVQQIQIALNALRLSGAPWLGLRIGTLLTPPIHGPIGFLAHSSPDLKTALESFRKFLPSRIRFMNIELQEHDGQLECLVDIHLGSDPVVYRSIFEVLSLSLLSLIEFILGRPLVEGHLLCRYPEPDYSDKYQDYISCPVTFGAPVSKLVLPISLCDTANVSANHDAYTVALQQCRELLEQLPRNQHTLTHKVMNLLISEPPNQWSEEHAAAHLFISKRTLARRLKKEGTGFWHIKDQLRSSMATNYLLESTLSIEAIAMLLGFHDAPNFRRAFKRWHGVAPSTFRASQHNR